MNPNTEKDFDFTEYNLDNLRIFDVKRNMEMPFLLPASQKDANGTDGYCLPLSCGDVLNHRRRMHEFTCHPSKSSYYDQFFGDSHSVDEIISHNFPHISALFAHLATNGLTSSCRYAMAPQYPGTARKDLSGCPLLRIDRYNFSHPLQLGHPKLVDDIQSELKAHGPLVAGFTCYKDVHRIARDFLYVPDEKAGFLCTARNPLKPVGHAVMAVGIGYARHRINLDEHLYLVIQNNWGERGNRIGRMPLKKFSAIYYPVINGQTDYGEYMKLQGTDAHADQRYQLRWK